MGRITAETTVAEAEAMLARCVCGGTGWIVLDVPVGYKTFGKAIRCRCQTDAAARARAERLRAESGLSEEQLRRWRFSTFEPAACRKPAGRAMSDGEWTRYVRGIVRACQEYAREPGGRWLVLIGGLGTGKTHLAYAIAAERVTRGRGTYANTAGGMLDMLRRAYKVGDFDERWAFLQEVELLVIDDLGTENRTDWVGERLYELINYRAREELATVVTTNVDLLDPAQTRVDRRIVSRLLEGVRAEGGRCTLLTLAGEDVRPYIARRGVRTVQGVAT